MKTLRTGSCRVPSRQRELGINRLVQAATRLADAPFLDLYRNCNYNKSKVRICCTNIHNCWTDGAKYAEKTLRSRIVRTLHPVSSLTRALTD